ncbi:hypothetical protein J5N97_017486 [Dioscorea zingiberensis]|uniref:Uncharacterized protein n=1 Tax=Dioscorea zingiberensis TaxID=325984 RepID=A0A9D5CLH5_9LILI|nr:hypothetical protein J5N97_017486 [Dioscorea zingiberensis]
MEENSKKEIKDWQDSKEFWDTIVYQKFEALVHFKDFEELQTMLRNDADSGSKPSPSQPTITSSLSKPGTFLPPVRPRRHSGYLCLAYGDPSPAPPHLHACATAAATGCLIVHAASTQACTPSPGELSPASAPHREISATSSAAGQPTPGRLPAARAVAAPPGDHH